MTDSPTLTHVNPQGGVRMVDVGAKPDTVRTAVAAGRVLLGSQAFQLVQENKVRKGDVLTVAQIAGIMGAKQTSKLIPLCHDVQVKGVDVELVLNEADQAIDIRAYAKTTGPTGVEMEALTAVSIAGLTIYDMCKSVSKEIVITDIHLLAKTGGQSGDYRKGQPD
ncbi:MAG: cyclic pyranopterin monophosphate synthase MoaC [Bacteroidetes bacterium]|nr:cyclic pyranopterin monophosphate synthase MoaC [Rhodothermaceae bacterium RA]RMH53598.1 MAG: cyclic pyranopterin monophosphate synthase MoaC [Bacteroidota bacterium]